MNCSNCGKVHDGYRCPYCGTFELEAGGSGKRKGSLYKKQRIRAGRSQWPGYIFLILFVGGWLAIVSYAVFSGNAGKSEVIIGFGSSKSPIHEDDYFTIAPKKIKVNKQGDIIATATVENTSSETVGLEVYAVRELMKSVEYPAGLEEETIALFEPGEKRKITVIVSGADLDKKGITELTSPGFLYHTYIYGDNMEAEQLDGASSFTINGKIAR